MRLLTYDRPQRPPTRLPARAEGGAAQLHDSDEDDGGGGGEGGLSKHQRRTAVMQARIAAMEAAAVGDKDWFLRGEAQAGTPPAPCPPPCRPRSCRHSPECFLGHSPY